MPTWQRGRVVIERLLATGELERVQPSETTTHRLLTTAAAHIDLAHKGVDDDPDGAFQLGYDAARKSCAALLAVQGLRATTHGGHVAVQEAVQAQFAGPNGVQVSRTSAPAAPRHGIPRPRQSHDHRRRRQGVPRPRNPDAPVSPPARRFRPPRPLLAKAARSGDVKLFYL